MKLLATLGLTIISLPLFAQDSTKKANTFYTGIFNQVPPHFGYPLIGVINSAEGDQEGLQLGFSNVNAGTLKGTQIGMANGVGKNSKGVQVGLVNATKDSTDGVQVALVNVSGARLHGGQVGLVNATGADVIGFTVGMVNATRSNYTGPQMGFVNLTAKKVNGTQIGFVNTVLDSTNGSQIGFVNSTLKTIDGAQIGFVNTTLKETHGAQIGFVNVSAKPITGAQIGFLNIADSVNGIPIGFLSVVRKGGYYALEIGASEMYPTQMAVKVGMRPFYTLFSMSYNSRFEKEWAWGAGFGSNLHFSKHVFFNPELIYQNSIESDAQAFSTANLMLGIQFNDHFSLVAGPDVVWSYKHAENDKAFYEPLHTFYSHTFDAQNRIHVGAKMGLRYRF